MTQKEYISLLEEYIEYVTNYPDDHQIVGDYPVCFDEWRFNDEPTAQEEKESRLDRKLNNKLKHKNL